MADIRPFKGIRPPANLAQQVASPPYDVLNSKEASALAKGNENSFLHVVKPEIDMPEGASIYDDSVYAKGAENLNRLIDTGALLHDDADSFYLYRQIMGDHIQIGLVAGVSVEEYVNGKIKQHEFTRRDKEDDRAKHVHTLNANTGPVYLFYPHVEAIDVLTKKLTSEKPHTDFTADDGIQHTLWVVDEKQDIDTFQTLFSQLEAMYIADGHHRSASAVRVCASRKEENPASTGDEAFNHFLAVIFPDNQMKILDYNRVLLDLNSMTPTSLKEKLEEVFDISQLNATGDNARPKKRETFSMLLENKWYSLTPKAGIVPENDPVNSLDVAILQQRVLTPLFGIEDPRTDKRIDFVGGIRGLKELERRCNEDGVVAFAMYPTGIDQLRAVADIGEVMPPKSTWFEPKLRSGMVVRTLD